MNRRIVMMITATLLLVGGGTYYTSTLNDQSQRSAKQAIPKKLGPRSTIQLEIVIDGGFAYIPSGSNTLNIAYLNSWTYANPLSRGGQRPAVETFSCNVEQMGTDLTVEGDIVEPSSGQTLYDLNKTIVTFPALVNSTASLSATRGVRNTSPFKPSPLNANAWEDLRFIPSLIAEHGAKLNTNWREIVNGYMELKGGTLKGVKPRKFADYTFDFRNGSDSKFMQAITDRTLYTVNVPGDRVEIDLDGDTGPDRIVVKPSGSSNVVRLFLVGKHGASAAKSLGHDDPLKEHCTFYQLFDPVPLPTVWLTPHLVAPGSAADRTKVPKTPGFFCPGDWF